MIQIETLMTTPMTKWRNTSGNKTPMKKIVLTFHLKSHNLRIIEVT